MNQHQRDRQAKASTFTQKEKYKTELRITCCTVKANLQLKLSRITYVDTTMQRNVQMNRVILKRCKNIHISLCIIKQDYLQEEEIKLYK